MLVLAMCEKNKINKKRPGLAHLKNKDGTKAYVIANVYSYK